MDVKKNILLGITGGIAAYKAAYIIRLLVKEKHVVKVIVTPSAFDFVTPLTLSTLSNNPVNSSFFDKKSGEWTSHVDLGNWADIFLIAPATANTMSKLSYGMADNMVTTTILASEAKKLLIPAMNTKMYINPITQENLQRLLGHGYEYMEPESGQMATKTEGSGIGRLPEPASIVDRVNEILTV